MATWSLLQSLTNFDFLSVASDGTDAYFVQYGGGANHQVFKYTVATDTISQISNDASWGVTGVLSAMAAGGLTVSCLQWFKGNLYVSVYAAGEANKVRVYRYDGAGTAWTNVLATTIASGSTYFGLFCTANYLVLGRSSRIDEIVDFGHYSGDGTSWSAITIGNTPAAYAGNRQCNGWSIRQGTDKIVFHDKSDNTADYNHRWFEWNDAGTLAITHYTENIGGGGWSPADTWLQTAGNIFPDVYYWYRDGTIWKYAAALGDAWVTPTNHQQGGVEVYPVTSIGFLDQCGDHNGDFVVLSGGAWGTPESAGTGGISQAVKMSNGDGLIFAFSGGDGAIYGRSEPFPVVTDEFRFVGLAADNTDLYATINDGGTLKLNAYGLATLAQVSTVSFGAATYVELDNRTRGIFPVVKPGNDGVVFTRGRDGNNNQVMLSEDYGASFADKSDAGWATDKYCAGLLPDPLNPDDLMACFGDNDLYQSQDGAASWAKTGDAPATLRAAGRYPTTPKELLLGAQADDTIYWTNNLGVSSEDVSDVALGQINVIEVSQPPEV